MLKFNNIKWLFKNNYLLILFLLVFVFIFSIYINFSTINYKLENNNKLIAYEIKTALSQYQTRLDLYSKSIKPDINLSTIQSSVFSTLYLLDKNGKVIEKNNKTDSIESFIEINEANLEKDEYYISDLITTKDFQHYLYIAKKMKDKFLVGKLELTKLLINIQKFDINFIFADSFGNVFYTSNSKHLNELENINQFKLYWNLSGIYQIGSKENFKIKNKIFYIRSFVRNSEFINVYFFFSIFSFFAFLLYLWSYYLSIKMLKNGLLKQINYCFNLQNSEILKKFASFDVIEGSDCLELQKSTVSKILEFKELENKYKEVNDRLNSIFNKSPIPALMIDSFTAKIIKANKIALEFYEQTQVGITKMNLYMLNKKDKDCIFQDPLDLAYSLQNSIKNQGYYIQTRHYLNKNNFKDLKIYPFKIYSKSYSYDILMIIDINSVKNNYISNQHNQAQISLNLSLKAGRLQIEDYDKNLEQILKQNNLTNTYFKNILHEHSLKTYSNMLTQLRKIKNNISEGTIGFFEHIFYLKQSNNKYSECKITFKVKKSSVDDNLQISAYLLPLRENIDNKILEENIYPYDGFFSNTDTILIITNKNFKIIKTNEEFKNLLKINDISNLLLKNIMCKDYNEIKNLILKKERTFKNTVYLKGSDEKIHPFKMSCITNKNNLGDEFYFLIFRYEREIFKLDDFMSYCIKNSNKSNESIYLEYCFSVFEKMILDNFSFKNINLNNVLETLNNINNLELTKKIDSLKNLIIAIKEDDENIMDYYENLKLVFKGEMNE